jgi:hypothetical protein
MVLFKVAGKAGFVHSWKIVLTSSTFRLENSPVQETGGKATGSSQE